MKMNIFFGGKLIFSGSFLICCLYLCFQIVMANLDLSDGRFALFMDELLSFDGIQKIYHPDSIRDFFHSIFNGGDHRYGRIFWNINALFSYIPYLVFGEKGQIISTRMLQSFLLLFSYYLLCRYFIKNYYLKRILFLTLLLLPTTAYYTHMPKPEPIQFFCLCQFLLFSISNSFKPHKQYRWFFLGLAFGAKISSLPFVLFSFFFCERKNELPIPLLAKIKIPYRLHPYVSFILSWFMAVPILFSGKWNTYYSHTFAQTGHGADNKNISLPEWWNYIVSDYLSLTNFGTFLFYLFIAISTLALIYYSAKKIKKSADTIEILSADLLIFVCGCSFLFPVLLFVKRLWPFYLHLGFCFILVGIFNGLQKLMPKSRFIVSLPLTILLLFFISAHFPRSLEIYQNLQVRTKSPEYTEKKEIYHSLLELLNRLELQENGDIYRIAIDPHLFVPRSTEKYRFFPIYGPFLQWEEAYDFVILSNNYYSRGNVLDPNNAEYSLNQKAIEQKNKYSNPSSSCTNSICYKRISDIKLTNLSFKLKE